jgi:cell division protein FtsB
MRLMAAKRRRRPSRASLLKRWLAVGALAVCGYLYYHPLVTYLEKRGDVAARQAEVGALEEERAALQAGLDAQTSEATLVREARRMAYVEPGEQLFIVKGIPEWRRAQAARRARATIGDDG